MKYACEDLKVCFFAEIVKFGQILTHLKLFVGANLKNQASD